MADLTPAAMHWLADHHGVITTAALRASHVGARTQRRLVESGVLVSQAKGVFTAAGPRSLEQRAAVLSMAHPGGFVSGPTAGMLAGLRKMPRSAQLHFTVPHGRHLPPLAVGVRYHQSRRLTPGDSIRRADGITVASWPRLAFDLGWYLDPLAHLSAVNELLHRGLTDVASLHVIGRRLRSPWRPGSNAFDELLARLGERPSESHPEVVVADQLRRHGIPAIAQERVLDLPDGSSVRLDFAVVDIRWGIEIDVHPSHLDVWGTTRDKRRDRLVHQLGWQVDRITELDLDDPGRVGRELAMLYARRCESLGRAAS